MRHLPQPPTSFCHCILVPLLFALGCFAAPNTAPAQPPRFPNAHEEPPAGWTGPVFELSQDYPTTLPAPEPRPWEEFDYKSQPNEYINAVLQYVYEGNIAVDWRIQDNTVRKWYHAPWMHLSRDRNGNDDGAGREFIHGMTKERFSRAKELAPTQTSRFHNWAVGFYNPPGGYTIGQVWLDADDPQVSAAKFPLGTVSAKLLFTTATVAEVPFLVGTFEWQGNIWKSFSDRERTPDTLRLLQIDVAVRDRCANDTTGWVFGTFIYQNDAEGATPWEKMRPVGLMWGNDPGVTPAMVTNGTVLQESWINPAVHLEHYGWADRLNGPVDNPKSSCLSCHSTAQIPSSSSVTFNENANPPDDPLRWFRNIKAGEPFDTDATSADYSLQISEGILNLLESQVPQPIHAARRDEAIQAAGEAPSYRIINGKKYYSISRGD